MLNRFTQKQLDKLGLSMPQGVSQATIPQGSLNIENKCLKFYLGGNYRIRFEKYIVEPYDGFNLHDNYNNGIPPKNRDVYCTVLNISASGKMVHLSTKGVSDGALWDGWVPVSSCNILEEM